ncbi:sortase [Paenibacillus tianjinensis]|uniref:Class D sortase n=1 Tax=Paenibacillus tianjinensis TaxID=2810347 RepID=A0ABX7LC05_9BACL|nr:sortase [Paenibacillus tianjinensis]QSF44913.1 class D sortase [Paenibacillus tianjinensis]
MRIRSGVAFAVKLIFLLSLCVLVYSAVQIFKAPVEARHALEDWAKKREEAPRLIVPEDETPLPAGMVSLSDKPDDSSASTSQPGTTYTEGEVIGEIYFPSLNKRVAILEGTQRPQLKRGAGHYTGSAVVGTSGNSVLAGHRDTVFRGLGSLKEHDLIEIETVDGKFVYEVTGSTIVDGEERGAIKESDTPILTLITCYPFSYVGSAPERYLLSASLIRREPLPQESN